MKLHQTVLQKTFTIIHKGKTYYVDYIASDDSIMLGNRNEWEIINEEFEPIENKKLKTKLINFCIRHFNDFKPED